MTPRRITAVGLVPVRLRLLAPAQNLEAAMALATGTIVVACPGEVAGATSGDCSRWIQPLDSYRTLARGGMLAEPWNVVFLADGRLLVAGASALTRAG